MHYVAYLFGILVFLVPSAFLGGLLLLSCILLILVGICMKCRKYKRELKQKKSGTCKTVNGTPKLKKTKLNNVAATNRLALSTSL